MKYLALTFVALWSIGGCQTSSQKIPFYDTPDFTPHWRADSIRHRITPFSFQSQEAKAFGTKELAGKIHVANFFFTICPSLCPKLMENMQLVAKAFAHDTTLQLVSFSVMPLKDSVSVLKRYAQVHHINASQWHLLTGDKKQIYTLARQSYFADENLGVQQNENAFLHTENFILVDAQFRIRGIYNGTLPSDITHLIEDIQLLEEEMQYK